MIKIAAAWLTCTVLASAQPSIAEKAVAIPIGSVVKMKLVDKTTLHGQLVSVSSTAITVRVADAGSVRERAVPLQDVRQIGLKNNQTGLKIMAGVGIAFSILFAIGLILASGSS